METDVQLNGINYSKCYHETGTKGIYLFDHQRFKQGLDAYAQKKGMKLESVYKSIDTEYRYEIDDGDDGISSSTLRKYGYVNYSGKYKSNQLRVPKNIKECKFLGKFLCGNEYAFLHRFADVDLDNEIKKIYRMLYDILFMYDTSNCYNRIPDKKHEIGVEKYFEELIDKVIKEINAIFLFNKEIRSKLLIIAEDTKVFLKRYEVLGVVDSWLEANPKIRYYDTVFDIMESEYMQYEKIRNGEYGRIHFGFYPTVHELECKKEYFKTIQEKKDMYDFSDAVYFKDELLNTLTILFEKNFNDIRMKMRSCY